MCAGKMTQQTRNKKTCFERALICDHGDLHNLVLALVVHKTTMRYN